MKNNAKKIVFTINKFNSLFVTNLDLILSNGKKILFNLKIVIFIILKIFKLNKFKNNFK
jgi:hypothetical protein